MPILEILATRMIRYKIKGIMLKKATRPPGIQGDLLVRFIKEGFIREISDPVLASFHL